MPMREWIATARHRLLARSQTTLQLLLIAACSTAAAQAGMAEGGPASSARVAVQLSASASVATGTPAHVTFGIPFPPGATTEVSRIRVLDAEGRELPSDVRELLQWRRLGPGSMTPTLRAVLVSTAVVFDESRQKKIEIEYSGPTRSRALEPPADVHDTWIPIEQGPDPKEYGQGSGIREPSVYAAIDPGWLGRSFLRSWMRPVGVDKGWRWYDEAQLGYARTAVNDVASSVTPGNQIDYLSSPEPWQLDRAASLWNVYIRTGDVKWLRHAHRASQFYAQHVGSNGAFTLKTSYADLKYSYGLSILIDYMLTGDASLLPVLESVAAFASRFAESYRTDLNFWTERHQAYALLAALTAWEATGSERHARRAIQVARATFQAALDPAGDWPADGCVLHTIRQHEGDPDDRPACSPWMSALLGEAVWRYQMFADDPQALEYLANLGTFLVEHGVRDVSDAHPQLRGRWAPWYLASRDVQYTDSGPWADIEHACDVGGLAARSAWAAQRLDRDTTKIRELLDRLLDGCRRSFESWHRTGDAAKPAWRLQPPRKFNWWFGTTSDLSWIASELSAAGD